MKFILLFLVLLTIIGCRSLHSPVLITPSYGILNSADIKAYEAIHNTPFNYMEGSVEKAYLVEKAYWQCFRSPDINVHCDPLGYIEEWESMGCNLLITVETDDQKTHVYWMPQEFPINYFHEKKIFWHKIIHNQKYVCFGGYHEPPNVVNGRIVHLNWTFDRIKTKIGSDSYSNELAEKEQDQISTFD
jgi:hypothetical protein